LFSLYQQLYDNCLPTTDLPSLLIIAATLAQALARTAPGDLRFQAAALAGLEVECMLLCVCDDTLAGDLPLEAANCALDAFVIVNLYSCHSKNLHLLTNDYTSRRGSRRFRRPGLRDRPCRRYPYWLCVSGGILYNVSARSFLALEKIVARQPRT
jgi:hypothetical protein